MHLDVSFTVGCMILDWQVIRRRAKARYAVHVIGAFFFSYLRLPHLDREISCFIAGLSFLQARRPGMAMLLLRRDRKAGKANSPDCPLATSLLSYLTAASGSYISLKLM